MRVPCITYVIYATVHLGAAGVIELLSNINHTNKAWSPIISESIAILCEIFDKRKLLHGNITRSKGCNTNTVTFH